jgi:uncharacterized protein YbaP (TraB family)
MKRILLAPLLVALLFAACSAQQRVPVGSVDTVRSLLWRIDKAGSKTSWLFGTMHMICSEDYLWTEAMEQGLRQSSLVCLEMDMDDPATIMQVAAGMMDTGGRTLRDYFTPQQYERLEQYVRDSLGMNLALFSRMKPFALQALFVTNIDDCSEQLSYESEIMNAAKKQGKEVVGLETAAQQLALVDRISVDSIVAAVMEMVDNPDPGTAEYQAMLAAYRSQDLERLHRIVMETEGIAELSGPFLEERNRAWIGRMAELMQGESVFFAVGAGHLWGAQGLIQLLRERGYTVTPVQTQ